MSTSSPPERSTQILDGKSLSTKLREQLKFDIQNHPNTNQHPPHLVVILVGNNPSSQTYIKMKRRACEEVGILFTLYHLAESTTTEQIIQNIELINHDINIHGCIVQLPLPEHINVDLVLHALDHKKDVDGFHPTNIGNMCLNKPAFIPATPLGIKLLLEHYHIPTKGRHVTILGKSLIVGQPLMNLLSLESGLGATVTACDKNTPDFSVHTSQSDIIIVATGIHHILKNPQTQLNPNNPPTVIDVGIHNIPDPTKKSGYRLEGDVDYQAIKPYTNAITPVPGGVGPMTVVALLINTWTAYLREI